MAGSLVEIIQLDSDGGKSVMDCGEQLEGVIWVPSCGLCYEFCEVTSWVTCARGDGGGTVCSVALYGS
jgi:hypothetical protein